MIAQEFDMNGSDRGALLPFGLALFSGFLALAPAAFAGKAMEAYGRESSELLTRKISPARYVARVGEIAQALRDEIARREAADASLISTPPRSRVRGSIRLTPDGPQHHCP